MPLSGTPGYFAAKTAEFRASTKNPPGASFVPLVKLNVIPSVNCSPLKSNVLVSVFFSSRNSTSSLLFVPKFGGWYMISVTFNPAKSCTT